MFQSAQKTTQSKNQDSGTPSKGTGLTPAQMMKGQEMASRLGAPAQMMAEEEEVQGKAIQKAPEEEGLQMKASGESSAGSAQSTGSTSPSPESAHTKMVNSFVTGFQRANIQQDNSSTPLEGAGVTPAQMMKGQVMASMLGAPAQMMAEEEVQGKAIQKAPEEEGLQMKASGESSVGSAQSTGSATSLPENVQAKMENSFGTSFQGVNIQQNDSSATNMGALAYTQGNNVHFAPGQYSPDSSKGQELIGHELTHVVQQREGRVSPTRQAKGMPVNDNPALENEADVMGKKAAEGKVVGGVGKGSGVQKKNDDDKKHAIGLKNGSVTESKQGVTVTGENAEGEKIRPANYSSKEEYERSEGLINDLETHAATHAFFEFVAHFLAYREPDYDPTKYPEINKLIEDNGYRYIGIYRGETGFQCVKLKSKRVGQNDIIAFRGTNPGLRPSDIATIYTDTNPTAVGYKQYVNNKPFIEKLLNASKSAKVDVAGHSLGGGLAQIVASFHTSKIGNVYTFQAPGIDDAMVSRFNETPENERPNVHHHIAVGDMVDKAGEQNIPGNVYTHDFGTYWIKTQDLLQNAGLNLQNIGRNIGGVISETNSINTNVSLGIIQSGIPFVGGKLLADKIQKATIDIRELNQHIDDIKSEALEFKTLMGNVMGAIGEAHLSYLFSSGNFSGDRADAGINDDFYLNKDEERGAGKEKVNEASVVTAHESYPHPDERKVAEPIRDAVGLGVDIWAAQSNLIAAYKTIDTVVKVLVAIQKAMLKLVMLLAKLAVSAWETIKEIPGQISDLIDDISYNLNYMNSIEFWMNLYR